MADMLIRGDLIPPSATAQKPAAPQQTGEKSFGAVLKDMLKGVNDMQADADEAIAKVQIENAGSIHEAMIALEKADLSFRAMMQVRNKILEAYNEVMRMQV
ncbi:MAG: flagellar hook-basal body complex protein FliE [Desulfobacterales bacterium]|jgi:flagellar hook-basal body complex protein FliE|nr:flagellar hook-basal body complex protein FliE [Desulfobacterales bacterium]MDD3080957.1 flagellar hook-basal body complex protein FliE [Desulfobacterales bacterium]MDD3949911.1 flagellar hook-basal body complex protein FliE [Desulfobacterales bacterium]MDD4464125.1 flagellar hook-basal body complex protein FliE [Desulfobacterales bacterium]MDY0377377.1 flagellar hook-basal body complex protein FliE [Desulfobacterales bacterium]